MAEFHSEDCKSIFDICTRFNMQIMDKDEAQAALKECDLSNKANFKDFVQRDLAVIFADEPKTKRAKVPVKQEDPTVEEADTHAVVLTEKE